METEIVSLIGSLGFPIAACVWFMVKGSKDSEKNTEALNGVKTALSELTFHINANKGGNPNE